MTQLSEHQVMDTFRRTLGAIIRRWWLIVGVVVLVGIGTSLTQFSAVSAPPYTESATFEIVAVSAGASNYDGYTTRVQAEAAEESVANDLISTTNAGAGLGSVAIAHSGDTVTLTVHAATAADADRLLQAALAAIGVATGSDAQLRMVVTSMPSGAIVDEVALRAAWRGIIERLVLAFVIGVVLAVAASLWEDRRMRVA